MPPKRAPLANAETRCFGLWLSSTADFPAAFDAFLAQMIPEVPPGPRRLRDDGSSVSENADVPLSHLACVPGLSLVRRHHDEIAGVERYGEADGPA